MMAMQCRLAARHLMHQVGEGGSVHYIKKRKMVYSMDDRNTKHNQFKVLSNVQNVSLEVSKSGIKLVSIN